MFMQAITEYCVEIKCPANRRLPVRPPAGYICQMYVQAAAYRQVCDIHCGMLAVSYYLRTFDNLITTPYIIERMHGYIFQETSWHEYQLISEYLSFAVSLRSLAW